MAAARRQSSSQHGCPAQSINIRARGGRNQLRPARHGAAACPVCVKQAGRRGQGMRADRRGRNRAGRVRPVSLARTGGVCSSATEETRVALAAPVRRVDPALTCPTRGWGCWAHVASDSACSAPGAWGWARARAPMAGAWAAASECAAVCGAGAWDWRAWWNERLSSWRTGNLMHVPSDRASTGGLGECWRPVVSTRTSPMPPVGMDYPASRQQCLLLSNRSPQSDRDRLRHTVLTCIRLASQYGIGRSDGTGGPT